MKSYLKPLFIQVKVDEVSVKLVDGGVAVNLMPQSLLKRIGKTDKDLKPHNVILSNYEGKAGHSFGALQVSLIVGLVVDQLYSWWSHRKLTSTCCWGENGFMGYVLFPHPCSKESRSREMLV
jgi:hypothetical protein